MAFEASVSGAKLRQFLQLLAAATRMSEGLFLEPTSQSLTLRAVSDSKSVHFVAVIPSTFFDTFKCPSSNPTLNLQLVSRAVASSALRFCPSLTRLVLQYNAAASPDVLDLSLLCQNGCVKIFSLFIGEESVSEKADVGTTDALMTFRAVAEPRVWTGLLGQFSSSTKSLCFQATEHRLTLMESDAADAASNGAQLTTFRAVVSADPKSFQSFTMVVSEHRHDGVDTNARLSTGGHGNAASHRHQGVSLPGKTFEIRPLRWMLLLCDALQLAVRFSTGGPGLPVHVEGLRRSSDGMCSFLSLLVAVVDSEPPVFPVPGALSTAARAAPSIASEGAARSASRRPRAPSHHATVMSIAPTGLSMGESAAVGAAQHGDDGEPAAVRLEPSLIAAHTAAAESLPTAAAIPPTALSVVPPSVAMDEEAAAAAPTSDTPTNGSDRKRAREELQPLVVVMSSDAAAVGVATTPAARSSSTSTAVPQSSAKRCSDEVSYAPPFEWANSIGHASGEIFAQFPLDFDALGSDDDEGADPCDDLALQQFIAARLATNRASSGGTSSTPSIVPQSATAYGGASTGTLGGVTQLDQVDLASALLMVPGTP